MTVTDRDKPGHVLAYERTNGQLRALVGRLAESLAQHVNASPDPGTEALSALYCAQREASATPGTQPMSADMRDALDRLVHAAVSDAMDAITVEASAGPESALGASEGFEFAVDLARDELPDRLLAVLALASTEETR